MKRNLKLLFLVFFVCSFTTTVFSQESDNSALIKKIKPSVVFIRIYGKENTLLATGTGFFVEPTRVLTNYHMVDGAYREEIKTSEGEIFDVKGVVAENRESDLAKIEVSVPIGKFSTLKYSDDKIEEGNRILIIGNPRGLEFTASEGIISAIRNEMQGTRIQYTAPISHGSSGSPIVNPKGEVIGIVTSTREEGQNLNFGTPYSKIKLLVDHELQDFKVWAVKEDEKLLTTPEGLYIKASNQFQNKYYNSTIYFLEQSLSKKPKYAKAWLLMADANDNLGNYEQAVRCANRAIEFDSTNTYYIVDLGDILADAKRYQEAIVAYKRAIYLQPDYLYTYSKLGDILSYVGRSTEAITVLEKSLSVDPKYEEAYFTMSTVYKRSEDYPKAIEAINKCLTINPERLSAYYRLGLCYEEQKKYFEASEAFEHAIQLFPNYYTAKYQLGSVLYYQKKYEKSIPYFQWCMEKDSNDAYAALMLGHVYRDLGEKEKALGFYKTANRIDPKSYDPLLQLSIAELKAGDYKDALPNLRRAIKLDPNNTEPYTYLSQLFLNTEDYNQSIEIAREAYEIAPDDYGVLKALSEAYYANEEYPSALEYAEKGESLFPKDANIIFLVGKCAIASKNKNLALAKCDVLKKLENQKLADDLFNIIYMK